MGKGWVRAIMAQLPDVHFRYAHNNPPEIVADLNCENIGLGQIPRLDPRTKVGKDADNNLYVNTWCGAWQGELFDYSSHSNFRIQHIMYQELARVIGSQLGREIVLDGPVEDYLPDIDFTRLQLHRQQAFVEEVLDQRRLILVCNGDVRSGQSDFGSMDSIIEGLSTAFPDDVILATQRTNIIGHNIFFTSDINNGGCDLNEVAWLGLHASAIIGKNSGPFTWCQNKAMLMKPKTFISLSRKSTDVPMTDLELPAKLFTSPTPDPALALEFILEKL